MEVVVDETLRVNPAYQAREDWPGLVDSFNGGGPTDGTAHTPSLPHRLLLLLGRDQAATKRASRVFVLVVLAELCAPMIYQEFTCERLATIVTTRSHPLEITFRMIRRAFMQVEASIANRFMAGSAKEML